jgi:hypothetical protein
MFAAILCALLSLATCQHIRAPHTIEETVETLVQTVQFLSNELDTKSGVITRLQADLDLQTIVNGQQITTNAHLQAQLGMYIVIWIFATGDYFAGIDISRRLVYHSRGLSGRSGHTLGLNLRLQCVVVFRTVLALHGLNGQIY